MSTIDDPDDDGWEPEPVKYTFAADTITKCDASTPKQECHIYKGDLITSIVSGPYHKAILCSKHYAERDTND